MAKHERAARVTGVRRWGVELAVLGGAMLVLALLGPFGSFARPVETRLLQWGIAIAGGYVFFRPVIAAGRASAAQSGMPVGVAIALACGFASIPTSVIVALAWTGFRWRGVTIADLAGLYPQVLIVGATLTVVQLLVRRAAPVPSAAPDVSSFAHPSSIEAEGAAPPPPVASDEAPPVVAVPATVGRAPFLDRLPAHLGETLLCLENEDHYVRAHTPAGSALILIRMRDAVAELEGVPGERVHRSWWVARDAVVAAVRQDRNLRLRLIDGREVPVARSSVATLRERGWLADLPTAP